MTISEAGEEAEGLSEGSGEALCFSEGLSSCFNIISSLRDDGFDRDPYGSRGGGGGFGKSDLDRSDDWEKEFEVLKSTKPSTSSGGGFGGGGGSEWNNNFDDKPRRGADFGYDDGYYA